MVIGESIAQGSKAVIWFKLTLRSIFSGVMNELIGMLGFMQLFVYFPLLSVSFPASALILYSKLIKFVSFELLPTSEMFKVFKIPDTEALSDKFIDYDYST